MSCIARAGWSAGMFSVSKLWKSSSISGPRRPEAGRAKIASMRSRVRVIGCSAPAPVLARAADIDRARARAWRRAQRLELAAPGLDRLLQRASWPVDARAAAGRSAAGSAPRPLRLFGQRTLSCRAQRRGPPRARRIGCASTSASVAATSGLGPRRLRAADGPCTARPWADPSRQAAARLGLAGATARSSSAEGLRLVDRQIGQHLAVDLQAGLLHPAISRL